jgi:hypothetical protein
MVLVPLQTGAGFSDMAESAEFLSCVGGARNFREHCALVYQHGVPPFPREDHMSAKQFHEFARECMRWAEEATSEEDRRAFIEMAQAWVHAAAELRDLSHQPKPSPRPRRARKKVNGARNPRLPT